MSFRELGEVLDIAEQTIARRYRRMRREGYLRVTMSKAITPGGGPTWLVRVRCRPASADAIAAAVAARDDVSWVAIYGAGWEVAFNLQAHRGAEADELLTRTLPRTATVLDVLSAEVLHTFIGGAGEHQDTWSNVLTAQQSAVLMAGAIPVDANGSAPPALDRTDRILIEELGRDGRTPYSTLARTVGSTPGKVTRRVVDLVTSGIAYFHVDLATAAIGLRIEALWLTVAPQHLASVGHALTTNPRIPFAAAVTGRANLTANIIVSSTTDLYTFVTQELSAIEGITGYELVPMLRRVKYAGALVDGDYLAPPGASPVRPTSTARSTT